MDLTRLEATSQGIAGKGALPFYRGDMVSGINKHLSNRYIYGVVTSVVYQVAKERPSLQLFTDPLELRVRDAEGHHHIFVRGPAGDHTLQRLKSIRESFRRTVVPRNPRILKYFMDVLSNGPSRFSATPTADASRAILLDDSSDDGPESQYSRLRRPIVYEPIDGVTPAAGAGFHSSVGAYSGSSPASLNYTTVGSPSDSNQEFYSSVLQPPQSASADSAPNVEREFYSSVRPPIPEESDYIIPG